MKNFIKNCTLRRKKIVVNLSVKNTPLTMDSFPESRKILKKYLPSIFKSKCFNPENLSFYKESEKTEIGHLFEHILLEFMCILKVPYVNEVSFSGRTYWNSNNLTGNFRVEICCSPVDWPIFITALEKSVKLMDLILETKDYTDVRRQPAHQTAPLITNLLEG